jgi:hypothetical protein
MNQRFAEYRRKSPSYVWCRQLSVESGLPSNRVAGGFDLDLLPFVRDAHFVDVLQREKPERCGMEATNH